MPSLLDSALNNEDSLMTDVGGQVCDPRTAEQKLVYPARQQALYETA